MQTATVPTAETWKLEDLFADDAAFATAKGALEAELPQLERFKGKLLSSAAELAAALDALTSSARRFAQLRCYAALKSDTDIRVEGGGGSGVAALQRREPRLLCAGHDLQRFDAIGRERQGDRTRVSQR